MKRRILKARALVVFMAFLAIAIGLAIHTGTGTISSFGIGEISSICPLGAFEVLMSGNVGTWHIAIGIAITVILALLLGRAFCGWVCPVPWVQRLLLGKKRMEVRSKGRKVDDSGSVSEAQESETFGKLGQVSPLVPVGGVRDGSLLDSRHLVLVGALASAAIFGFPVFCAICPVGLSVAMFVTVWHVFQFGEVTWGLLVYPAIVILEVVVFRKWCHALCPMGALLSLLSRANRTVKPAVDSSTCLRAGGHDCTACVEACPERLDSHTDKIPECTKCGICIENCPAQAISFKLLDTINDLRK